jgi:uncharacterized protein (DUF58 family)
MIRKPFIAIVRSDRWLRIRFTPVGRLLLCALVAAGLFALNPRATLAYQLAILILALVFSAMLWAPAFRPVCSVRRLLPKFATVGVPIKYTLEIDNHKQIDFVGLEAVDESARATSKQAMHQARTEAQRRRGQDGAPWWIPSGVGYVSFVRSLRSLEGIQCEASAITQLSAQVVTRVPMRCTATRRGYVWLSKVRITRTDPLGIFRAASRLPIEDQLLVLPRRYRVSWNSAGPSSRNAQHGTNRSRNSGSGADFAHLREYRPRDPLRHIHWRAWARLGEPIVKVFHEESPSRNALVFDVCAPVNVAASTFEEAVCVAASFVTQTNWCSGQLDLLVAGDRKVRGNEGEGTVRMLEALACVHIAHDDDFLTLAKDLTHDLSRFSACVLVLLDFDQQRLQLVRELQQAQINTLVLVVSEHSPSEVAAAASSLPAPRQIQVIDPRRAAHALTMLQPVGGAGG